MNYSPPMAVQVLGFNGNRFPFHLCRHLPWLWSMIVLDMLL